MMMRNPISPHLMAVRHKFLPITVTRAQRRLMLIAVLLAVGWWGFGLYLRQSELPLMVWGDQFWIFLKKSADALDPYRVAGFFNVPWARAILLPFALLPFTLGVLTQMIVYFLALAGIVYKFSPPSASTMRRSATLLIVLASPLALDTAIELNIDWIVVIGLLVPPAYSGPLLLIKPQAAIGYVASFRWSTLVRWVLVVLVVVLLSLLIWGAWFVDLYDSYQFYPVGVAVNVAPMNIIGRLPAMLIGGILLVLAFRRKDTVAGVWGGIFLMPYVASYSILLPYTLLAVRFPRIVALLTLALWLAVGIIILQWT